MAQTLMEKTTFNYSMKNIPIPTKDAYRTNLITKVDSFIKRMRWRAFFFLYPVESQQPNRFNLKSKRNPPQVDALKPFEEDLIGMIQNLKFRPVHNEFQKTLQQDIAKINSSTKVLTFADKTRNLYELEKEQHEKLLRENITKNYKKADDSTISSINQELKSIATKLNISDRIETMPKQQAFITLKDHKDNFRNNPTCRLINPAKSNLGLVSKQILENINTKVRNHNKANQWKNSHEVIDWFNSLSNKKSLSFLIFDIVDFYPSISETLLRNAIDYASQITGISKQDRDIIMHARQSLLFDKENPWTKRNNTSLFDVTMGSFDGAEVCELVGLYLLDKLTRTFNNHDNIGLYRDDGLAAFRNMGPRTADRTRKKFIEIFEESGLKITIQSNLKIVNYLDITLNLLTEKYSPYRKPDNPPQYINVQSNHPPSILKQLPTNISSRISSLSHDKHEFDKAAPTYNEALKSSGFPQQLVYSNTNRTTKNRPRKTLWFNPPFSSSVQTNVGKQFLSLIDKHFPRQNTLHKIFNRGTTKVSYSCMQNMKSVVNRHNSKILKPKQTTKTHERTCNCRSKADCPLDGACLTKNLVYKATVTTENTADSTETKTYIGMTENEFKTRFTNHKLSFNNRKYSSSTALSKYIWELKQANTAYLIKWSILKRANAYKSGGKQCNLCLAEKLCILKADKSILNKRSEVLTKCRHENKFYAANIKPP